MRARQILQISGLLLLCLFLLSACDGCGPLDTLRVDSPLDESEITLPIQNGYGQLAGTSAYFRTKQTPRDLYQAYKALEAEKGLRVTPYPAGLLIEQTVGSGARYYWLAATRESTKRGRWYLLSNMEAKIVDRDTWFEEEWTPQQGGDVQTPVTGAMILLPYHLLAQEAQVPFNEVSKDTFTAGVLYRMEESPESFYQFYESMNVYRLEKRENGFSILSYAEGFDASKALRTCPAVTFIFHTIGGNTYFSAQLD